MEIKFIESSIKMPMMTLPLRTTLVKVNGKVIIFSPLNFTNEQLDEIKRFGPVSDLVAPSLLHHLYIGHAIKNFPEAKVWAVPGLPEKRPEVQWSATLTDGTWTYPSIELLQIEGLGKISEVVFFCKELKTLLVTDLVFNLQNVKGIRSLILLSLFGTYRRFAVSRLIRHFVTDRRALRQSLLKLLMWDFDQIVMAHGDVLRSQGHHALTQALKERKYI